MQDADKESYDNFSDFYHRQIRSDVKNRSFSSEVQLIKNLRPKASPKKRNCCQFSKDFLTSISSISSNLERRNLINIFLLQSSFYTRTIDFPSPISLQTESQSVQLFQSWPCCLPMTFLRKQLSFGKTAINFRTSFISLN